jgi:hypothetical protein
MCDSDYSPLTSTLQELFKDFRFTSDERAKHFAQVIEAMPSLGAVLTTDQVR